jgi:hypothetical protein
LKSARTITTGLAVVTEEGMGNNSSCPLPGRGEHSPMAVKHTLTADARCLIIN